MIRSFISTPPVVVRESATSIRIDLPFAMGMHYDLDQARALRNALTAAIEAISPGDERVQEAIAWGRQEGLRRAAQDGYAITVNTGRIHAIKKFREITGCGLGDAKVAIDRAWPYKETP